MPENPQHPLLGKIAAYTDILAADPCSTIFVPLSESYRRMGMLAKALSVAEKGLEKLPEHAPGHVVLARIKCQQGDMDVSAAAFTRALEIDPDNLAALVGFSRLYLLLDNIAGARELLLIARQLSPADSVINKLLLSLPEPEVEPEVEPEIEAAAVLTDEPVEPEFTMVSPVESLETATMAELYLKQGMSDRALEIFQKLLLRDPDNLGLRRRIRDIELLTSGSDGALAETPQSPDEEAVSETAPEDVVIASSAPFIEEEIPQPDSISAVAEMSVLDHLNSLLTSIQKRRGDV